MKLTLQDRLLRREIGGVSHHYPGIRGLYGDTQFIQDLDIVNELDGHSGCVNALSWSRSGRILASGSDDKLVNLYKYLPDDSADQFSLATTIDTGHVSNVFSVKFMPHSNDRTVVTAARDSQIRVFDIERAAHSTGTRVHLSAVSTNAKIFGSHSASVKRIVTEASPFYFLSCSEDGDVRQFDIRQQDSAYPRQRSRFRQVGAGDGARADGPPPLISYANYNIELYSISCSASQPHYIAIGGTHLHCFLHDRRMLGRDRLRERGGLLSPDATSTQFESALEEATRCVAKFAPYGQPKMGRTDRKQITACKLSDANPNELIVSWTGDFIYNFNILRDQQSQLHGKRYGPLMKSSNVAETGSREGKKRKRLHIGTDGPSDRQNSRRRTSSHGDDGSRDREGLRMILRVGNGGSIELPISSHQLPRSLLHATRMSRDAHESSGLAHAQRVRVLKAELYNSLLFDLSDAVPQKMTTVLLRSAKELEKIEEFMSNSTYPVTESSATIDYELKLRGDRAKTWRFIQSSGTIARVLLRFRDQSNPDPSLDQVDMSNFETVRPAPRESSLQLERHERFAYDLIKAILLWLDSGAGAVLRGFTADTADSASPDMHRLPVSRDAGIEAIDTELIPYLERLATDLPVAYSDSSGGPDFTLFTSEKTAVKAFSSVMKIPFADLTGAALVTTQAEDVDEEEEAEPRVSAQNRSTAIKFWGHKVCLALLRSAAIDINYSFVASAFGDQRSSRYREGRSRQRAHASNDEDEDEEDEEDEDEDEEQQQQQQQQQQEATIEDEEEFEDSDSDEEDYLSSDEDSGYDLIVDEDEDGARRKTFSKYTAGRGVPSVTHLRHYRGHCNVETTKDVNFYGLQDEYVVSGSDCGNLFIWETKSGRLVDILKGDCEVVNVVQPHPYEPMIAVAGIDSTAKIFSPDARSRRAAALGIGVTPTDSATFSSIGLRSSRRNRASQNASVRRRNRQDGNQDGNQDDESSTQQRRDQRRRQEDDDSDEENHSIARNGFPSRKRMQLEYLITSENDMNRRSGGHSSSISRSMMALLAQRLGAQMVEGEEGVDDNCSVM